MKNLCAIIFLLILSGASGQTAANFNCKDCSGVTRNLYADLDAGKVVVIIWVMPCLDCVDDSKISQAEYKKAIVNYPGKVVYYFADDNGDTDCATLTAWANTYGINDAVYISDTTVNMKAYGKPGMPKVAVLGGASHKVYYNMNVPSITAEGITTAIHSAFSDLATGLVDQQKNRPAFGMYPNPTRTTFTITFHQPKDMPVKIAIQNQAGQKISDVVNAVLSAGDHAIQVNTLELANGTYFISFSDGSKTRLEKFVVDH